MLKNNLKIRMAFFFLACMLFAGCQTPAKSTRIDAFQKMAADSDEILASDLNFDIQRGKITYTLPEPALVRVRIGLADGGPLLHTLVDWEPRKAGKHIEVWDKKDSAKKVDFSGHKDFLVMLSCLPLDPKKHAEYHGPIRGIGKSPEFEIVFPNNLGSNGEMPIVPEIVPIRVVLSEKDKPRLTEAKYEIGIYLDYIFVMEDEEGMSPFTYLLNTKGLNDGPHILTVNIGAYTGEVGSKSIRIFVKNSP